MMNVAGFFNESLIHPVGAAPVNTKMLFIVIGLRARTSTVEAAPDFLALRNIYRKDSKYLTRIHLPMSAELEQEEPCNYHNYVCTGG